MTNDTLEANNESSVTTGIDEVDLDNDESFDMDDIDFNDFVDQIETYGYDYDADVESVSLSSWESYYIDGYTAWHAFITEFPEYSED